MSTAGTGLRERKRNALVGTILREAGALFLAKGFEATTLAMVGEAAETSVPTLMRLFGGKQRLFSEVARAGGWEPRTVLSCLLDPEVAMELCAVFEDRAARERAANG